MHLDTLMKSFNGEHGGKERQKAYQKSVNRVIHLSQGKYALKGHRQKTEGCPSNNQPDVCGQVCLRGTSIYGAKQND